MAWLLSAIIIGTLIIIMGKSLIRHHRINFNFVFLVTGIPSPQQGHGQPQAGSPSIPGPSVSKLPTGGAVGGIRKARSGFREWKRGDPTLFNALWKSRQPLGIRKQLGNAEVYIMLVLAIGFVTVVIGCWLSDNCWSPDPDGHIITVA